MFRTFGYAAAVMRDDDIRPAAAAEEALKGAGGTVVAWRDGRCLEQELFWSMATDSVEKLVQQAVAFVGEELVDEHIKSASGNAYSFGAILTLCRERKLTQDHRVALGQAALSKANPWFKSVSRMEDVGRLVVGPGLERADRAFKMSIEGLFEWAERVG
jgi:hypothetical protein